MERHRALCGLRRWHLLPGIPRVEGEGPVLLVDGRLQGGGLHRLGRRGTGASRRLSGLVRAVSDDWGPAIPRTVDRAGRRIAERTAGRRDQRPAVAQPPRFTRRRHRPDAEDRRPRFHDHRGHAGRLPLARVRAALGSARCERGWLGAQRPVARGRRPSPPRCGRPAVRGRDAHHRRRAGSRPPREQRPLDGAGDLASRRHDRRDRRGLARVPVRGGLRPADCVRERRQPPAGACRRASPRNRHQARPRRRPLPHRPSRPDGEHRPVGGGWRTGHADRGRRLARARGVVSGRGAVPGFSSASTGTCRCSARRSPPPPGFCAALRLRCRRRAAMCRRRCRTAAARQAIDAGTRSEAAWSCCS